MPKCCHFLLLLVLGSGLGVGWAQGDSPQTSSPSSSSSSRKHGANAPSSTDSPLTAGTVKDNVYRNSALGFSCKIPVGWVLRTEEMNEQDDSAAPAAAGKSDERVLLGAFLRPPQARGEDVNASVVIAAESVATYPGLKAAAQYFGPLTEVIKARGFKVAEEPYEFPVDGKMLVRGDFQKNVGTKVMQQSTLVMVAKGYVLSFTFIAGGEDDVNELVEGLRFGVSGKAVR